MLRLPHPAPLRDASSRAPLGFVALLAIGVVAFAARAAYLLVASAHGLFGDLFLDSRWYAAEAAAIRLGEPDGARPYLLSPLYPYVLALFTGADGALDVGAVRWMQAVVGALCAVVVSALAARLGGRAAGWIAGLAAALYAPAIHIGATLLVASLQAFSLALGVYLIVDEPRGRRATPARWLAAGIAFGIAAALHPTSLAVAVACWARLAYDVWRGESTRSELSRRSLAYLAGLALVIAPFTVQNLVASRELVLLSANGGINFWIGNEAHATGLFRAPAGYDFANDPVGRGLAERASGRTLSYREASAWWRGRALADVHAEPVRAVALFGRKLLLFLHPREIPQLGDGLHWFRDRAWPLRFPLDAFTVLVLALAAPLVARARGGRDGLARLRWPITALLAYTVAVALFFVNGRYRAPVMPIALALAAVATVDLCALAFARVARRPRAAFVIGGAIVIAALAGRLPYTRPGAPLAISESTAVEERHRGMSLYREGRYAEAVGVYEHALASEGDPATRTNLANALKALGRAEEAAEQYRRVLATTPDDGVAWYNYGNLLRQNIRDPRGAREAYARATELRPRMAEAHYNLGAVLIDLEEYEDAAASIESALGLAPTTAPWREEAEDALVRAHALARARR